MVLIASCRRFAQSIAAAVVVQPNFWINFTIKFCVPPPRFFVLLVGGGAGDPVTFIDYTRDGAVVVGLGDGTVVELYRKGANGTMGMVQVVFMKGNAGKGSWGPCQMTLDPSR